MKTIGKYIILALSLLWAIFVIAVLPSCTPQKRLDRLLRNHPELLQHRDTVTVYDTVIAPAIAADTVFSAKFDTVTMVRDCVRVWLVKHRDTIRLTLTKPADTVVKTIKVPIKIANATIEPLSKLETWLLTLVAIVLLFLLVYGSMKMPRKTDGDYYDKK